MVLGYVALHLLIRRSVQSWTSQRIQRTIHDAYVLLVSGNDDGGRRERVTADIADLARIATAAVLSARALAVALVLVGTTIALAQLSASFRQVQRLDAQNRLLEAQTVEMEINRTATVFNSQLETFLRSFGPELSRTLEDLTLEEHDGSEYPELIYEDLAERIEPALVSLATSVQPNKHTITIDGVHRSISMECRHLVVSLISSGIPFHWFDGLPFRLTVPL